MNRTSCSETMSQNSNGTSSDQSRNNLNEKEVERPQIETISLQHTSYSPKLLQTYLGEFLVQELREAIHSASHRIIENNQRIEALEEKVRGYEDHIDCLEQLVRELQLMLRTTIAANADDANQNVSHEVQCPSLEISPSSLVEVPLEEEADCQKSVPTAALHQRNSPASRLLSFLSCKPSETKSLLSASKIKRTLKPKTSEERVDINDGSLSDFN